LVFICNWIIGNYCMQGNYIDLIIILVLLYFATEAWRHGFWVILIDFISFLSSLLVSFRFYKYLAAFLQANFNLTHSVANALGFLISAITLESLIGYILGRLISRLPERFWKHKLNRVLGIIPGICEGIILIAFILTLILSLPVSPKIKNDVADSKIGHAILQQTLGLEKGINDIFGGAIEDSLTYLTVKPGSKERISLTIERENLTVDEKSEAEMFGLVNSERKKEGIKELEWSPNITAVARKYAEKMWQEKYFGHVSPEGEDVGDRLNKAKIKFSLAGENLALAPTVSTAFTGLMNSEGHRENILDSRFHRVGIGVMDNGFYGKLFVQIFTD
jgi:uncharacterized protein YkwD/membrane protein YqaA with SNARE-associated domain